MAGLIDTRRRSLSGTAATVLAACRDDDNARSLPGGPALKGVNYDTDHKFGRPELCGGRSSRSGDLHCNAIFLVGSDLERLTEGARSLPTTACPCGSSHAPVRHADAAHTLAFVADVARACRGFAPSTTRWR